MAEYEEVTVCVRKAFERELLKHEAEATQVAIQAARNCGLDEISAQWFAYQVVDDELRGMHK